MAARFEALRDDHVATACFEPSRLGDRRRGRRDAAVGTLHALDQSRIGQSEMEAHDLHLRLYDDVAHRVIERRARWDVGVHGAIDAELVVVGGEPCAPRSVIAMRRLVTEEVDVQRLPRSQAHLRDLAAHLLRRHQRASERAEPARFADRRRELRSRYARHRRLKGNPSRQGTLAMPVRRPARETASV